MFASVIVEIGAKKLDKTFTYSVPKDMQDKIKIGSRVKVPFGYQKLEGFVINISNENKNIEYDIREVEELVDIDPIINEEMFKLGYYMHDKLLCSLISAFQVMLPKALKASYETNINIKYVKYVVFNKSNSGIEEYIRSCKYEKQVNILNEIKNNGRIKYKSESSINTLIKKGYIRVIEEECDRFRYDGEIKKRDITLNDEQRNAVDNISKRFNTSRCILLYGVTGSGKTEVYIELIKKVVDSGKDAIMLVPEISLTPQIVARFKSCFGDNMAVLHSGLNDSEKYDEYRKIRDGKVNIVIGARSAIFAPLKNIGIIIIDEEHSTTYKQDNHPRYDARDIALYRCKYHNCPLVIGSATPSLESFARAGNGVYDLVMMKNRAKGAKLPSVEIVDMKKELKKGNFVISSILESKIRERLERGEQVIVLLNRRGYSSMLTCKNCGYVAKCPRCDISLTYHKTSGMMRCHYCGYSIKRLERCPECGEDKFHDFGLGTQQLEEVIKKQFDCSVVRMDTDTTSRKGMHEKIIEDFSNHKYDILVGTQMIAKGLDFPNVTLVGVVNADASLNVPDFRSAERTFQLLSQVAGRAGRGDKNGEVVIQTYNEEHYSIVLSKNHNYLEFYKEEMKLRKKLNYSPYYFITLISIKSKDYEYGSNVSYKICDYLRNNLSKDSYVLGPSMGNPFKINNIYSYNIIIKYKKDDKLKNTLINIDNIYKVDNKVNVEIDINPNRL